MSDVSTVVTNQIQVQKSLCAGLLCALYIRAPECPGRPSESLCTVNTKTHLACSAGLFWVAGRNLWFYDRGRLGRVKIITLDSRHFLLSSGVSIWRFHGQKHSCARWKRPCCRLRRTLQEFWGKISVFLNSRFQETILSYRFLIQISWSVNLH